jgi:hypothetical protein
MQKLQYSAELLAPLTALSGPHELYLRPAGELPEGLEVVCQLTGLRLLHMRDFAKSEGLLLQLPEMRQLTQLEFGGYWCGVDVEFGVQVGALSLGL